MTLPDSEDFILVIPFVTGEELLAKAIKSVEPLWRHTKIIDNSDARIFRDVSSGLGYPQYYSPPVPLSFSQSLNLAFDWARHRDFCLFQHSDAEAVDDSASKLLGFCRGLNAQKRKWGVVFTNYDSLAAYNMEMVREVGLADTNLPCYFTDNDYFRRVRLAGWETVDSGFPVKHYTSATIKLDPEKHFLNSVTFPLYKAYYEARWGGPTHHETYTTPFNRGKK